MSAGVQLLRTKLGKVKGRTALQKRNEGKMIH